MLCLNLTLLGLISLISGTRLLLLSLNFLITDCHRSSLPIDIKVYLHLYKPERLSNKIYL